MLKIRYVDLMLIISGIGHETAQAIATEISNISKFSEFAKLIRSSSLNQTYKQRGSVKVYGKLEKD
ncbi:MAG: hypothetical protein ACP5GH_01400 [Nitrososphaeria archaeon]